MSLRLALPAMPLVVPVALAIASEMMALALSLPVRLAIMVYLEPELPVRAAARARA